MVAHLGTRPSTYVVEPQTLFVPLLTSVLATAGLDVVAVAPELDLARVMATAPDVVFIDPDFAPIDTLDAVRASRTVLPQATICVYTSMHRPAYSHACFAAGANCVISKAATDDDLERALAEALAGLPYADPRVDAA